MKISEYKPGMWLKKKILTVTHPGKQDKFLTLSIEAKTSDSTKRNCYIQAIQYPYGRIVDLHLGVHVETCEPKDWQDNSRFMTAYKEHFECN